MRAHLFLEPNIEVDVITLSRSTQDTAHNHWKTTADGNCRTCGATKQQKRWQGLTVHSLVSSCMPTFSRYPTHALIARGVGLFPPGSRMQQSHNPCHLDSGDSFTTLPLGQR